MPCLNTDLWNSAKGQAMRKVEELHIKVRFHQVFCYILLVQSQIKLSHLYR